jgi:hypothetical protein
VPEEANIFTAGLDIERIRTSEKEAVVHVKECEWARYFQERHPQCGYLMACSTDEAACRAFNKNLRMQRTSTLMEGGKICRRLSKEKEVQKCRPITWRSYLSLDFAL